MRTPGHRDDDSHGMRTVVFSEEYYRAVIAEFGYEKFELARFDFDFAAMSADELNLRYLCHHKADLFLTQDRDRRTVTTGFGMSGIPHLGTVAQLMQTVRVQRGGERCQIVLGDLDAYNGRGRAFAETRDLAERFRIFAVHLGFDETRGTIRDQVSHDQALLTMYLLARYTSDNDFNEAEEDNHSHDVAHGVVEPTMTLRRRLSLLLMAADFVTLGQSSDGVLVFLGIDEHRYVRFAQRLLSRLDSDSPLGSDFTMSAVYTRLGTGFNGFPKQSKSIPGSSITMEMSHDEVHRMVMTDSVSAPETSPVYQIMQQTLFCSYDELERYYWLCKHQSPGWDAARARLVDYIVSIQDMWPQ